MLKKPDISIIICTHNRADTLNKSLQRYQELDSLDSAEILVVLNCCTDDSAQVVSQWQSSIPLLKPIVSTEIGHSHARNDGLHAASAPFVFYIDDDAYPQQNLISTLLNDLKSFEIKCISGRTVLWKENSPKWVNDKLVATPIFRHELGEMPKHGYINGCACGFDRSTLMQLGGFDSQLGMKGKELGYFDEVHVQKKFMDQDHTIYFDPNLIVHHSSHQQSIKEFYHAALVKGRSARLVEENGTKANFKLKRLLRDHILFIFELFKATVSAPYHMFRSGVKSGLIYSYNRAIYLAGKNLS